MSDKLTRKELKAPDSFQKIGAEAVPFFVAHQRNIVLSVVGVLVVGGGIALVSYLGERRELQAQHDLGASLMALGREISPTPPAADAEGPAPFKNEGEKNAELVKALTEFRQVQSGTRAAAAAGLPLGQALLREGKAPEALSAFDDYLKVSTADDPLRPMAIEGKGYALEAKKDYDAALLAFDQLAKENRTEFMKGMGLYHRGRILLLQGKTDDAVKQLQDIDAVAPASSASRLAAERISVLASQGVKIPEKPKLVPAVTDAGL